MPSSRPRPKAFRFRPRHRQSATLIPSLSPGIKCTDCAFSTPFLVLQGSATNLFPFSTTFEETTANLYLKGNFLLSLKISSALALTPHSPDFPLHSLFPLTTQMRNATEIDCAYVIDEFCYIW